MNLYATSHTFKVALRFTKSARHVSGHLTQGSGNCQEQSLIHVQKYFVACHDMREKTA